MADAFQLDIKYRPEHKKSLIIPAEISVPQYSIIKWNIIIDYDSRYWEDERNREFYKRDLFFHIYFKGSSPFDWKNKYQVIHHDPRIDDRYSGYFYPPYPIMQVSLSEDVANNKGDYKYGVSVSEDKDKEPFYDEDPYIHIF